MKLWELTTHEASEKLRQKEISSEELTRSVIERIEEVDQKVGAYLEVTGEQAIERARAIDQEFRAKEFHSLLMGIPCAIKDNILVQGMRATAGSRILEHYRAAYDATVIDRLKKAGMVMVGKTNLDEFAMGSSTENSAFKTTKNPWDFGRVPGGSSGGSAAAVASRECCYALGSDTGGSVRQPASLCGVVGLKPTYGRVSRYGLIALASSLDQIGPIATTVRDAAIVFQTIAGFDPHDSTTATEEVPKDINLDESIRGLRIGIPKEYFHEGMDEDVEAVVKTATKTLESLGAQFEEVSLPSTDYALACYYVILPSEASANLARYDGIRYGHSASSENLFEVYLRSRSEGFGDEVKRRIMIGTYALSSGYYEAYYLQAQKVRTLVERDFASVFQTVDVLLTPTSPTTAFPLGEKFNDPLTMYLSDIYTVSANIGGVPAISIPCGFVRNLPVGLQFIGRPFDEATLLRVAHQYERATPWHEQHPSI